jgi:hypothetical protein
VWKEKISRKPFSSEEKRAPLKLWKAIVPLKTVRNQLKMSEWNLRGILAHEKGNPDDPVSVRRSRNWRVFKIPKATLRKMKKLLQKYPTMSANQLKARIPNLAKISYRHFKRLCLKKLDLPSGRMAYKTPPHQEDEVEEDGPNQ